MIQAVPISSENITTFARVLGARMSEMFINQQAGRQKPIDILFIFFALLCFHGIKAHTNILDFEPNREPGLV